MKALTRRRMGAGLAAALAGGASARAGGPLFRDLPNLMVPPHLQRITTHGHGRPGVGGAAYRRCAPGDPTAYRTRSADGACWELAELQITPEQAGAAGNGRDDDREAMMAAQALARPLTLTPGRNYRVGSTLGLSVPISGGGRITAGPGFRGDVLIHGRPGFHLHNVTLDGAGLAAPARKWLGVGAPEGSAIYLEGKPDGPGAGTQIDGVTVRNTPGGGLMARDAPGIRILNFVADGVQTQTAILTGAVIELYRCDDGEVRDCAIRNYRWKGYSLGACKRTVVIACTAQGGNPGHAAHYIDDCEDCGFTHCDHSGEGYAAKASNALRAYFHGYRSSGSAGGLQVQSCRDFEARDVVVSDSLGPALVVSASTAGPMVGCQITGARASWSKAPGPEQIGLMMTCNGAQNTQLTGVRVQDLQVQGGFFGVHCRPAPGSNVELDLEGVRIEGAVQYGIVAYLRSLTVRGGTIETQGGFPALAILSNAGASGGDIALSDLGLSGGAGHTALVEVGAPSGRSAAFAGLSLVGDTARGGRGLLDAHLSGGSTDSPIRVELMDNSALGLADANGVDVTFADGAKAEVVASGNRFRNATGGLGPLRLGPRSALVSTQFHANQAIVTVS